MIFGGRSFSGRERHCVFLNTGAQNTSEQSAGGPQFACVSAVSGLDLADDGRALALVDWDFDGDQDVWISNRNAPRLRFLRNDVPTDNHFLAVRLEGNGTSTNRDAIGARVELYFDGSEHPPLIRTLHAGDGFLSQSSKWLHFGIGQADGIEKVVVRWPAGDAETFVDLKRDAHYRLVQGSGVAAKWTPPQRSLELQPSAPQIVPPSGVARIPLAYRLPMVAVPYERFDGGREWLRFDSGRPTLINLWASWCRPCLGELNELTARSDEVRAAGIDVVALSVDGLSDDGSTTESAEQAIARVGFPFMIGRATPELLGALQSMHNRQIPMRRPLPLPTSFLVDARGHLSVIYKGPLSVDELLADTLQGSRTSQQRFVDAAPFPGRTIDDPKIDAVRRRVETLIRFRLGMDVEQAGRLAEAARHYQGVLELEPDYAEVHNNLGNVLARGNVLIPAEEHLRRAIELKPQFDLAHHNLANVLLQRDRVSEAIAEYQQSVRLAPQHPGYRYSLGNAWLRSGDFRAAAASLRKATELDPSFVDAHNNLGFALEKLGKRADALACYQRALELNPQHPRAAANLERLRKNSN